MNSLRCQGRLIAVACLVCMYLSAGTLSVAADLSTSREYQVKAVFLYNFAQFVEWPPSAFGDPETPIVIGVLGDDPFGRYLDDAVRGEKVNQRPMVIRRYRRIEEVGDCHILFVSRSEGARLEPILASLEDRSILTVSDFDQFTKRGGMIRFVTEKGKIRLHINIGAAKAASLTISSKLLRPAEIVVTGQD